jgi:hypothetical protein
MSVHKIPAIPGKFNKGRDPDHKSKLSLADRIKEKRERRVAASKTEPQERM